MWFSIKQQWDGQSAFSSRHWWFVPTSLYHYVQICYEDHQSPQTDIESSYTGGRKIGAHQLPPSSKACKSTKQWISAHICYVQQWYIHVQPIETSDTIAIGCSHVTRVKTSDRVQYSLGLFIIPWVWVKLYLGQDQCLLEAFAKLQHVTISFVMPVRLSARNNSDFHKLLCWRLLLKHAEKIRVWLESYNDIRHFTRTWISSHVR
jgi:hypothetical protein